MICGLTWCSMDSTATRNAFLIASGVLAPWAIMQMPFTPRSGPPPYSSNYEEYSGKPLLGVNGICIIAHGASTPLAIKNALRVAVESIEHQVNPHIIEEVQRYHEAAAPLEPAIR